jgi:hypothetical protein
LREQHDGRPPDDVEGYGGNDRSRAYCAQDGGAFAVVDFEDREHGPRLLLWVMRSPHLNAWLDLRRLVRGFARIELPAQLLARR